MAGTDRTEKPTPKRRREAREKGQVARSMEISSAAVLVGGLIGVIAFGPTVVSNTGAAMQAIWSEIAVRGAVTSASGLHGLEQIAIKLMLETVAPIAGICLAVGLLANVAQVGLRPSIQALRPQWERLNPGAGVKRLFGKRVPFEAGKSLAKVTVVGAVAAISLVPMITHGETTMGATPAALGSLMFSGAKTIAIRVLAVYLLISVADYVWQKRQFEKGLKMTKQEVKDESRNQDLPPEVKSAIRRRRILQARARMMAAVPQADVVVTNPTHYAVALVYDGKKPAPVVVAKGKNLIAAQIRRIAAENGVPIVPDPPLARSLHASVEIDQMIPAELYAAVAQVLAHVYRMAGRRAAERKAAA
ncbi:MAG TPA: flagellar biosynthesis protein FlhB [Solirubrobacteraceae bacterium]|nr:flagellar biosynthesis protein FlhB [Solirubrobacteraceae bacterium]